MKTLVQCDFDGTITEEDVSFFLLDGFAQGDWHQILNDYKENRISVGRFNSQAFALVRADKVALLKAIRGNIKVRKGFPELVKYCSGKGFRLVIVSNGLEFYIKAVLEEIGLGGIEVYAAQAEFNTDGIDVKYVGLDGEQLDDGLKEMLIQSFLEQGYRVIYIGNGTSDVKPAMHAHGVFATGELIDRCEEYELRCNPFDDFIDVVEALESL